MRLALSRRRVGRQPPATPVGALLYNPHHRSTECPHMPAAPNAAKPARKFHFISGLPRSGSTLLAAILNQNPRFRAGMTSPLADIMGVVLAETSSKNDFSFAVSAEQRLSLLRGLVENLYAGRARADVVF